ncbi:MAG: hypothetical protein LBP22_05890 [Deltaproteobacteria bacterium]|nr:hypothetical protein [Deltaproteobacteria bacterium]
MEKTILIIPQLRTAGLRDQRRAPTAAGLTASPREPVPRLCGACLPVRPGTAFRTDLFPRLQIELVRQELAERTGPGTREKPWAPHELGAWLKRCRSSL